MLADDRPNIAVVWLCRRQERCNEPEHNWPLTCHSARKDFAVRPDVVERGPELTFGKRFVDEHQTPAVHGEISIRRRSECVGVVVAIIWRVVGTFPPFESDHVLDLLVLEDVDEVAVIGEAAESVAVGRAGCVDW